VWWRVFSTVFILSVCLASPVIFAAAAWFTRASTRRATAALVGGVVAALLNIGWDGVADRMDWWSYAFTSSDAITPLALYIPVAFVFGAAAGLVGWRMMRAMGWTGVAVFFSAFVGLGVIRDHVIAAQSDVFVFGPGGAPHVVDALGYLTLALAVQVVMLVMAGPPKRDALRAG
jgi:hypothetical protein